MALFNTALFTGMVVNALSGETPILANAFVTPQTTSVSFSVWLDVTFDAPQTQPSLPVTVTVASAMAAQSDPNLWLKQGVSKRLLACPNPSERRVVVKLEGLVVVGDRIMIILSSPGRIGFTVNNVYLIESDWN